MPVVGQTLLLFTLNFVDAVLTIYWVRNGIATEGNQLMATLLDIGDFPFLAVKVAVGAVAAVVLWNWGHLRLAKYGLGTALVIYSALMGVHFVTGLSAMGIVTVGTISSTETISSGFAALLF